VFRTSSFGFLFNHLYNVCVGALAFFYLIFKDFRISLVVVPSVVFGLMLSLVDEIIEIITAWSDDVGE
jgi:hypothetical protein